MLKQYYARSKNSFGERETVHHHLKRVSQLCGDFLAPLGYREMGEALGGYHDFGKYSDRFAEVLKGKRTHVNHAYPGAALAYCQYYNYKETAKMLATVIAAHHSCLDYDCILAIRRLLQGTDSEFDEEGKFFSLFGKKEMEEALAVFQAENPQLAKIRISPVKLVEKSPTARMLFVRFLLSALADADYSASAEHFEPDYLKMHTGSELRAEDALEHLIRLHNEKKSGSTASAALNGLRDRLFEDCLLAANQSPGLFTLTAPTGLGKTLSLFAFAVRHCATYRQMRRIILILPYLAIAEQNVADYRKLIPELLESHSAADLDEETRLLAERWSAPCIVTTNVGFFEPLFSARPTDCRHLHQIANSVIVLDEAQSLPPGLLEATLETVKLLCSQYGCTVVFSTATQPSFQYLVDFPWTPREIVPNPEILFQSTRRVRYDWRLEQQISFEQVAEEATEWEQVCIIVNLRAHAVKLFRLLEQKKPEETFFLTSDLCSAHRSQVLKTVKERLAQGKSCYLVATQCIEAGVDIDFPVVYRALAPLEAVIQAAGRCNRNGNGQNGRVIVFLPNEDKLYPPGPYYERAAICVKNLASRHPIDCHDLKHIEEYYELLYSNMEGDKESLKASIQELNFERVQKEYRLIDSKGVQVIVLWEEERELFCSIQEEYAKEGLTRQLMTRAQRITVSSFAIEWVKRCCIPLTFRIRGTERQATDWYLLGNPKCYQDKLGLNFDTLEEFDGII